MDVPCALANKSGPDREVSVEVDRGASSADTTTAAIGQIVSTPYGPGTVIETRKDHIVVEPSTGTMAMGQKPTFYMNRADVRGVVSPEDKVQTIFGRGEVQGVRDDGVIVVLLDHWKLANGTSPVLYLQDDCVTVMGEDDGDSRVNVAVCNSSMSMYSGRSCNHKVCVQAEAVINSAVTIPPADTPTPIGQPVEAILADGTPNYHLHGVVAEGAKESSEEDNMAGAEQRRSEVTSSGKEVRLPGREGERDGPHTKGIMGGTGGGGLMSWLQDQEGLEGGSDDEFVIS